jgi:hypothetical protein
VPEGPADIRLAAPAPTTVAGSGSCLPAGGLSVEALVASAIGVLTAAGTYLVLRGHSFP